MEKTDFGFKENVFTDEVMKSRLSEETYGALLRAREGSEELSRENADKIAEAMMKWALEKGATHYCHWFQPLSGFTAEKHDSFLAPQHENGKGLLHLSGKNLIKGESDASGFPSGGIRSTFEARGYTVWDLSSPVFVSESSCGIMLYIPTAFCSYTGESLDKKTPLLRSEKVISEQALRFVKLFGYNDVKKVIPYVGAEQEYFIIDRKKYLRRDDLIFTGRTLFGAEPPKGQEMDDHYMGPIPARVGAFMNDVNHELWKLGVPAKTEHNEAAPAQHELAVNYEEVNIATDHNQIVMEKLKETAEKHDLVCLLHEKPFAGVNGSGKHNNWSVCTDTGVNLLHAGKNPHENLMFMLFLTVVIRAVDLHGDLLLASAADVGNEARLGGNEAPTTIMSMYIGTQLEDVLNQFLKSGDAASSLQGEKLFGDVNGIAGLIGDATDRNRTSPFAFTGDKFEFRSVGSKDSIAEPNIVLNTIVAESLQVTCDRLSRAKDVETEARLIIREYAEKHGKVVYNGDNYDPAWHEEAARRNLCSVSDAVSAGTVLLKEDVTKLYSSFGIYSPAELSSRAEIQFERYAKAMHVEAKTMISMASQKFIPAVIGSISETALAVRNLKEAKIPVSTLPEEARVKEASQLLSEAEKALRCLEKRVSSAAAISSRYDQAVFYRDKVVPAMEELRKPIDKLELLTDRRKWPVPSYSDLMYEL